MKKHSPIGWDLKVTRPGLRIYRLPAYHVRPFAVYSGDKFVGTYRSVEDAKKDYPTAEHKRRVLK